MSEEINDIAAKVCELIVAGRPPDGVACAEATRVHTAGGKVYDLAPSEFRRFKRMLREASARYLHENPPNRHERRKAARSR